MIMSENHNGKNVKAKEDPPLSLVAKVGLFKKSV